VADEVRRLRLWQDKVETDVAIGGNGPPLVYLHGPYGLDPDGDFLSRLRERFTVYAPKHPGTTPGDPDAISRIDGWWDLLLYYRELFDRLELGAPVVVGHSFGGLVAAELAAMPNCVSKLVLISPVGLWRDDLPVRNWMILSEARRPAALFADPAGEAARRFVRFPEEPEARVEAQAAFIWSQACTGKFVWPIPDRGLGNRIHRIVAPTLILWGKADAIVAPEYAQEFARRIAGSRVELIERAGHFLHHEQPDPVVRALHSFLAA
jgi:pimeloyl-ACP methyl ester carboxylesterase